jgi:hypothetical protein
LFLSDPAQGVFMPEGNTGAASWRAVIGDPESKAHSRYTLRRQGNQ